MSCPCFNMSVFSNMRVACEGHLTRSHDITPSVGIVTMPTLVTSHDDITCRSTGERPEISEDLAGTRTDHPWVSQNIHRYTIHSVLRTISMHAEGIFFLPFTYLT